VEKALKAWLSLSGIEYPWTHDLEQLFALLEQCGETIPDNFRSLVELTDFAVQFRYEAFEGPDSEVDRMQVIDRVTELIKHVDDLLKKVEAEV
jgi:HEPN domain-containing protein